MSSRDESRERFRDADGIVAPFTGLARSHWLGMADDLLLALRPYSTPRHALIELPGPSSKFGRWSDGLEAFARSFELASYRIAGDENDPHGLIDWYSLGLTAGADPSSPERWPTLTECRQARVEAASLAIGFHETRESLWNQLPSRTQEQVVGWLSTYVGVRELENNHVWFQSIVEAFLQSVGGTFSQADLDRNEELHEQWYVGDGWFSDGASLNTNRGSVDPLERRLQHFDYYSGVLHVLPLWCSRILGKDPAHYHKERLMLYLDDLQHMVAANGAPIFQGRSLTYRWSMLWPFWAGAIFEATPLSPGLTRRVASGVLRHFTEAGVPNEEGLLPVGWYRSFPSMRQQYSGAGSPYWAAKGFAGLLLDSLDPVWTQQEEPLPIDVGEVLRSIEPPGWIVSGTKEDGIIRLINHGSDRLQDNFSAIDDPFYARHTYSTHAAPDIDQRSFLAPLDSHVALIDMKDNPSHRGRIDRVLGEKNVIVSRMRCLWPTVDDPEPSSAVWPVLRMGPICTSASVIRGAIEVRIARVESSPKPRTDPDPHWPIASGPWRLHIGGWAVADEGAPPDTSSDGRTALVSRSGLASAITGLRGLDTAGVSTATGANPFGRFSAFPWVRSSGPVVEGDICAAAVILTGGPIHLDGLPTIAVSKSAEGDMVWVNWRDGEADTVHLPQQ